MENKEGSGGWGDFKNAIKKELYFKDSSQLTSILCHLYRPRGFYVSK